VLLERQEKREQLEKMENPAQTVLMVQSERKVTQERVVYQVVQGMQVLLVSWDHQVLKVKKDLKVFLETTVPPRKLVSRDIKVQLVQSVILVRPVPEEKQVEKVKKVGEECQESPVCEEHLV